MQWLEVTLREGTNRQIRRMLAGVGLPVLRICRVKVGNFSILEQPKLMEPGSSVELLEQELFCPPALFPMQMAARLHNGPHDQKRVFRPPGRDWRG
jgi:hypothetical protein